MLHSQQAKMIYQLRNTSSRQVGPRTAALGTRVTAIVRSGMNGRPWRRQRRHVGDGPETRGANQVWANAFETLAQWCGLHASKMQAVRNGELGEGEQDWNANEPKGTGAP